MEIVYESSFYDPKPARSSFNRPTMFARRDRERYRSTKLSIAAAAMIQTGLIFVRASTMVPTIMSAACHGVSMA